MQGGVLCYTYDFLKKYSKTYPALCGGRYVSGASVVVPKGNRCASLLVGCFGYSESRVATGAPHRRAARTVGRWH